MSTKTRFEKEAKGNSEMVYSHTARSGSPELLRPVGQHLGHKALIGGWKT